MDYPSQYLFKKQNSKQLLYKKPAIINRKLVQVAIIITAIIKLIKIFKKIIYFLHYLQLLSRIQMLASSINFTTKSKNCLKPNIKNYNFVGWTIALCQGTKVLGRVNPRLWTYQVNLQILKVFQIFLFFLLYFCVVQNLNYRLQV